RLATPLGGFRDPLAVQLLRVLRGVVLLVRAQEQYDAHQRQQLLHVTPPGKGMSWCREYCRRAEWQRETAPSAGRRALKPEPRTHFSPGPSTPWRVARGSVCRLARSAGAAPRSRG